jgi:hypothetical protein
MFACLRAHYRSDNGAESDSSIRTEKFTMRRKSSIFTSLLLAAALITPVVSVGCAGHVGIYDEWHGDYHRWDDHEEVVYRGYLADNHKDYHPFNQLSKDDQKAYFDWRHNHP